MLYGKVNAGMISDNNEVAVYGYRDFNNNIVARKVCNRATGTVVMPQNAMSATAVRILALLLAILMVVVCVGLGWEGILTVIVLIIAICNWRLVLRLVGGFFRLLFRLIRC
jgi:hypothetical protein